MYAISLTGLSPPGL